MKCKQQRSIVIAPHHINSWKLKSIKSEKRWRCPFWSSPFWGSEQFNSCMIAHNYLKNKFLASKCRFQLYPIKKIIKTSMFVEHKCKKKEENRELIVVKYLISEKRLMLLLFFALFMYLLTFCSISQNAFFYSQKCWTVRTMVIEKLKKGECQYAM